MQNHELYEKITISKLIEYILTFSDNTAHLMLINYIGIDTIKSYFNEYNLLITKTDPYIRNYTAEKAFKCLEKLYNLLEVNDKYSTLIKKGMNNNYLNFYINMVFMILTIMI